MPLVSDNLVQLAFDYLNENSEKAAAAKAAKVHAEYKTKKTKAKLFLEAPQGPMDQKKAWAESHDDFETAYKEEVSAIYEDEKHREYKAKSLAILDAWRTEQANVRGVKNI